MLSGVASGVITARDLDAPVSYEGLAKIDSGLGSLGFIVYDDTADMVAVARTVSRFLVRGVVRPMPGVQVRYGRGHRVPRQHRDR